MIDAADTIDTRFSCELCENELGQLGFDRYVEVLYGSAFASFCSMKCARLARRARGAVLWAARWRAAAESIVAVVLAAGLMPPHEGPPARPHVLYRAAPPVPAPGPEVLPPGWFGPVWPPTEASLLEALGRDAWVHPLSGPYRRMPRSDSRVFGAVRPGNRPIECRNGHCGVDLGGELFGEQIHAVHDGVVDYVQRGLTPDRGARAVGGGLTWRPMTWRWATAASSAGAATATSNGSCCCRDGAPTCTARRAAWPTASSSSAAPGRRSCGGAGWRLFRWP